MNAKEILEFLDRDGFDGYIITETDGPTILRALRLLAAAEGGEGTVEIRNVTECVDAYTAALTDERNALAARVVELEKDAERWRVTRAHHIFNLGGARTPEEADKSADEAIAILKQRDAARSK